MELPEYHPYWIEMKNPESGIVTVWRCIGRKYINGEPANFLYKLVCEKNILDDISVSELPYKPVR